MIVPSKLSEDPKDLRWFICQFSSVDRSAAHDKNMGYPQVPGSIPADVLSMIIYSEEGPDRSSVIHSSLELSG